MEHLCKIELIGVVGRANLQTVGDHTAVRFSLAVQSSYGDFINTDWFSCVWWPKDEKEAEKISKGSVVHLEGRITSQQYVSHNGRPATYYEVKVNKVY